MKNSHIKHKAKYSLVNLHCGKCETGVVQIHSKISSRGVVSTGISGCLDCGYEYGLRQARDLKKYDRDDIVWN